MKTTKTVSPKFSFDGYSVKVWAIKNKDSIKTIVAAICAIIAGSFQNSPLMQGLFGAGTGVLTKFILDGLEFYLSEVSI